MMPRTSESCRMHSTVPAHVRQHAFLCLLLLTLAAVAQQTASDELLQRAIEEQQRGDLNTAIADFRKLLQSHPQDAQLKVNLGAALAQIGKYDEAIEMYRSALATLKTDRKMVIMNLGLAYYKQGDYQHARDQFASLHRTHPDELRIAILLGDSNLHLGNADAALKVVQPLESSYSGNPDFEYVLGSALIHVGRKREGVERLEKAARAGPSADAYMLAGATLLELEDYDQARKDLEEALRLNPALPRIQTSVGIARDKSGDIPAAEAAFRQAIELNPDDFDANLYLGSILAKRHQADEAKGYLDRALRLKPRDRVARYESAMLKSISGDYAAAALDLEQLARDDPGWLDPHIELAVLYYRLHRVEDGQRERQIVNAINAKKQGQGPSRP